MAGATLVRLRHPSYVRLVVDPTHATLFYATANAAARHMEARPNDSDDDDSSGSHDDEEEEEEGTPCVRFDVGWAPLLAALVAGGQGEGAFISLATLPRPRGASLAAAADVVRGLVVADLVDLQSSRAH
jgi:hypothetical protein